MAQTTTRTSFNFIPQHVEAQIAGQQMGDLLEVYQLGWKRDAKGKDRAGSILFKIGLTFAGAAGTVGSVFVLIDVIQTTHFIVSTLFLLPVSTLLIFLVGIFSFSYSPFCVAAFSEGLIYSRGKRVTLLRWQEIASYQQSRKKTRYRGVITTHSIHTHTGKVLNWKADARLLQSLSKIIREHVPA